MDPFAAMGMGINTSLAWCSSMDGRVVQLLFNENQGPQELVCRHPFNWGWVLHSQATWVRIRILPPPRRPLLAALLECNAPVTAI